MIKKSISYLVSIFNFLSEVLNILEKTLSFSLPFVCPGK